VSSTHPGPKSRFLLLSDSCGFVHVGLPLWQLGRSVVYNCWWPPRQRSHSQVQVPHNWRPYFTLPDSRFAQPGGPGPRIYIPQEQGAPVMPPGTGFTFCRLLQLAGLQWRYSNPPPREVVVPYLSSPVNFCRPLPVQSFLVSGPLGTQDHIFVLPRLLSVLKLGLLFDERRVIRHSQHIKHRVQQFSRCCMFIRYRGNVFTEPFTSSGPGTYLSSCCLATLEDATKETQRARWSHKPPFIFNFFQNKEIG
jgi:hypothetical protein